MQQPWGSRTTAANQCNGQRLTPWGSRTTAANQCTGQR